MSIIKNIRDNIRTVSSKHFITQVEHGFNVYTNDKVKNHMVKVLSENQNKYRTKDDGTIAYGGSYTFSVPKNKLISGLQFIIENTAFGGTASTSAVTNCIESVEFLNNDTRISTFDKDYLAAFSYWFQKSERRSELTSISNVGASKVAANTEVIYIPTPYKTGLYLNNDENHNDVFFNAIDKFQVRIHFVDNAANWATSTGGTVALPSQITLKYHEVILDDKEKNLVKDSYRNKPYKIYDVGTRFSKAFTTATGVTTESAFTMNINAVNNTNLYGFFAYFKQGNLRAFNSVDSAPSFTDIELELDSTKIDEYKTDTEVKSENYQIFGHALMDGVYFFKVGGDLDSLQKNKVNYNKMISQSINFKVGQITGLTAETSYTFVLQPLIISHLEVDSSGNTELSKN